MGFPPKIATKALTECSRSCAICHKFCGSKMELHHIKQVADGGDDTFANCIPLCFDCHADVKAYDPNHPKGKKYTESELIAHRDKWYEKVKNSFSNDNFITKSNFQADKKLFGEICDIFTDDVRMWLSKMDLGGSHPYAVFEPFSLLLHKCDDPFYEFLDIEIEKFKGSLIFSIKAFLSYKAVNTFVRDVGGEKLCVTRQWMTTHEDWVPQNMSYEEYSKRYEAEASTLNELATKVWEEYTVFVRHSRRLLDL